MKVLLSFFIGVILLSPNYLQAQTNEGNEFWFSFMEHRNPLRNTKVVMITSRVNTSGIVSAPNLGYSQPFTVAANDVTIIELPIDAETLGSNSISQNGYRVTSNDPVSVYIHQYHSMRSEATVVLPKNTIGRDYYTLSYKGYFTMGEHYPSQFIIVGTQDDTNISFVLSANSMNGANQAQTVNITLDAGETYQVQGRNPDDDLSGTYITGDKNFSLFCGSRYTALNCLRGGRDNLLEQSFPTSSWGNRFVAAPFQDNIDDIYRILSIENNTNVSVIFDDGTSRNYNLDKGEIIEYDEDRYSYIESSNPILIAQYMNQLQCGNGFSGDPAMLYLNSILQIRDTVTLYNSNFEEITENYINVIGRTDDRDNIQFNGQGIEDLSQSTRLLGTNDEYISFTISVTQGAYTITSSGCGVIAKAYGLGFFESYAYSGGASFNRINSNPIPEGGCLNDTVFFDTNLPPDRYNVEWIFEGGDTIREHVFERIFNNVRFYPLQLNIHDECFGIFDTLYNDLEITVRQAVDTPPIDDYCEGDEIQLFATDVDRARYEWLGPSDYSSEEQNPIITNVTPDKSGTYSVVGIVSGCYTFPAEVQLLINPNPTPDLGADAVICPKSEVETILSPGTFESYLWSDGSIDSNFVVLSEGMLDVAVTDENSCIGMDTINIIQQCPTEIYIPNVFTPNGTGDVTNETFGVFGEDIISLELRIYDRWGNKVFESREEGVVWDGKLNGKQADQGVYSWVLNLEGFDEDGSTFQKTMDGTVLLLR